MLTPREEFDGAPFSIGRRGETAAIARAHYQHVVQNGGEHTPGFLMAMCAFNTQEAIVDAYGLDHVPLPENDNAPRAEQNA